MKKIIDTFKKKLHKDMGVFGPFMITSDPAFVEAAGYAGFDFAVLDMEHGPGTYENLQNLIRTAQISRIMPIVRVQRGLDIWIDRALDLDAGGVLIPQIDNAAQAESAIAAAKFAPIGNRGVCRYVRAAKYSAQTPEAYFREANDTVVILQAEGKKAIENLDQIIAVKGFDILFIGPYDLSSSLGLIGQIDHPEVHKCMKDIIKRGAEKNVHVGIFLDCVNKVPFWRNLGVKMFAYSCDTGIFYNAAKKDVEAFKG